MTVATNVTYIMLLSFGRTFCSVSLYLSLSDCLSASPIFSSFHHYIFESEAEMLDAGEGDGAKEKSLFDIQPYMDKPFVIVLYALLWLFGLMPLTIIVHRI